MRSLHSLRSVEMTYCVVPFRQNRNPLRHFVANHPPCRNKRMRKSVNPLGLAQNPRIFALAKTGCTSAIQSKLWLHSVCTVLAPENLFILLLVLVIVNKLVVFLFHIELICLLERERGLQGCKPRSLLWSSMRITCIICHLVLISSLVWTKVRTRGLRCIVLRNSGID